MTSPIYDGGTPTTDFSTTEEGRIDYASPAGMVRLNITDVADAPADRLFTDEQLTAFLTQSRENINRASARALRVIAASEVLTSKVIRTQDRSADGAKVAAELRALADTYDAQANADEASGTEGFFDVVPFGGSTGAEGEEARWY